MTRQPNKILQSLFIVFGASSDTLLFDSSKAGAAVRKNLVVWAVLRVANFVTRRAGPIRPDIDNMVDEKERYVISRSRWSHFHLRAEFTNLTARMCHVSLLSRSFCHQLCKKFMGKSLVFI